jgi:hypothetical protein
MKWLLLLAVLASLLGCGIHVTSDPIIVTHTLDLSLVRPYCEQKCNYDATCVTTCINDFLLTLSGVTVK